MEQPSQANKSQLISHGNYTVFTFDGKVVTDKRKKLDIRGAATPSE